MELNERQKLLKRMGGSGMGPLREYCEWHISDIHNKLEKAEDVKQLQGSIKLVRTMLKDIEELKHKGG